jgi:hypothetical protein
MTQTSKLRLAQLSIAVLLLVIIRSLSEVFRLQYLHGEALVLAQLTPYIAGALFTAVALGLAVICYFASLHRASITIAATRSFSCSSTRASPWVDLAGRKLAPRTLSR